MIGLRIAKVIGLLTLGTSGFYVFFYLERWEWNRALISGILFLAAEIGLIGASILGRLRDEATRSPGTNARVRTALRTARPAAGKPFAWLCRDPSRLGVFVPVLMGAGVLISALAWLVEHLARASVSPAMELSLQADLVALHWPEGGLLCEGMPDDGELLRGPVLHEVQD